ncbi:MAG: glutathione S-transferase [Propionibacteriaceae bacterium]|jgi:putative glutathione S-transferase|nr:glutathione S-transferase [Propionibacteriaceae bacterium]
MTLSPTLETTLPELTAEQTPDGAFRRQRNWFSGRFGPAPGQFPVEPGRYAVFGSLGCGWARRQRIILRLLGLEQAVRFVQLSDRDEDGWLIAPDGADLVARFGTRRLNDFYRGTDPNYQGRGTSPTVVDLETGRVVSNNYHLLPQDWETAWAPYHRDGAPDLYPEHLRREIDLLNQQLFDDVNNGTYKVLFATNPAAARVAHTVFAARLADLEFRLTSRRYLFGDAVTDSDVRLFQTLSSYERAYRPGLAAVLGEGVVHVTDYPALWGYARDLFAQGFADPLEQYFLGLLPGPDGGYLAGKGFAPPGYLLPPPAEALAAWRQPSGREALTGSPYYSGPGGGGSAERWTFA